MTGASISRMMVAASIAFAVLALPPPGSAADDLAAMQKQVDAALNARRYAEAEGIARRMVEVATTTSTDPRVIGGSHNRLGRVYYAWGRYADAEKSYRQALDLYERTFGPAHILTALAVNNVAEVYRSQRRFDEAEPLYRRAGEIAGKLPPSLDSALIFGNFSLYRQVRGQTGEAEQLLRRALAIREKVWGADSRLLIPTLDRLAGLCLQELHYAEAERVLKRSLKIRETASGAETPAVAQGLEALADLYLDEARNDEAEPLVRRALAIREKAQGQQHVDVATSLLYLGVVLYRKGHYAEAEGLLERALAMREQAFGPEHLKVAIVLRHLGSVHRSRGRYAEAEAQLRRALAIREKIQGPEHLEVSHDLNALSVLYHDQARLSETEATLQRALGIREKRLGANHPLMAQSCNNLAVLYEREARYAEAESLYKRALAIATRARGPQHPSTALYTNNLAALYDIQGRYAEGEPLHKRALAAAEKALGPDHPDLARFFLSGLANSYSDQGRYNEAEPLYKRALRITEKTNDPESPLLASALADLANIDLLLGRYREAESLLKRALAINEKNHGADSAAAAGCLYGLANVTSRQGRVAEAESMYRKVLAIREKVFGPDHPLVALSLSRYAEMLFDRGRAIEAEPLIDQAIEIRDRIHSAPGTRSRCYLDRARIEWSLKERSDALADLKRAMDLAEEQRGHIGGGEHERAESFQKYARAFELMVAWQAELGDVGEALNAIERARARSLLDEMNMGGADLMVGRTAAERAQLRRRESDLKVKVASLEKQLGQASGGREETGKAGPRSADAAKLQSQLNRAREDLYRFYRDERGSNPVYRNLLSVGAGTPRIAQIRRRLVADQGLMLVYFFGADGGYLLTIGPHAERLVALATDKDAARLLGIPAGPLTARRLQSALINEKKEGILQLLADPDTATRAIPRLAALWQILIPESERKQLTGGVLSRLIVVPDGPLALLPLEVLVVESGEDPRYLLDVGPPIHYGPSATLLFNLAGRPALRSDAPGSHVLTVGDPVYPGAGDESASQAAGALKDLTTRSRYAALGLHPAPLPFSGVESGWVADDFTRVGLPTTRLLKEKATKANVRTNASGSRILHLACHGLAEQSYGNFFGALLLTPGPNADTDPTNDGFLTLSEIYELNLKDCELTVLSACETNYGPQQQGEGVWALSRGFLVAGSRRVVASTWLVDDEAAASLVSYFCSNIAQAGKAGEADYARALHDAKRWVRRQEKWHNPFYWGTFVLVGPK